jgi:hypothetical protein
MIIGVKKNQPDDVFLRTKKLLSIDLKSKIKKTWMKWIKRSVPVHDR